MSGKKFNKDADTKLIAEIANTHQGDKNYVFKLLSELKKNNINYVKFQIYNASDFFAFFFHRFSSL